MLGSLPVYGQEEKEMTKEEISNAELDELTKAFDEDMAGPKTLEELTGGKKSSEEKNVDEN